MDKYPDNYLSLYDIGIWYHLLSITDILVHRTIRPGEERKNRPNSGRFHYWLIAAKVTTFRRRIYASIRGTEVFVSVPRYSLNISVGTTINTAHPCRT